METPQKKTEEQTPVAAPKELKDAPTWPHDAKRRRIGVVVVLALGAVTMLVLGFTAGWASRHEAADRFIVGPGVHREIFGSDGPALKHRGFGEQVNPTDGNTISRLSGVVTQVGSDSFTIAGNGTTKTIKTDADTSYSVSSNKVSVNDSVTVRGTQAGDTFTADTVTVLNR